MTPQIKLLTALPLIALTAGCVGGGDDVVDTQSEIEATTDTDIDSDGTIPQSGMEVGISS